MTCLHKAASLDEFDDENENASKNAVGLPSPAAPELSMRACMGVALAE